VDPTIARSSAVGVVTVDDQAVFREVAHELVDATPGFSPVGEAASGEEALRLVGEQRPGLVLVDLQMPDMDGVETARCISRDYPWAVVVLISVDEPLDVPATVSQSGATAFVRKQDLEPATLGGLWSAHGHGA
jgi:two-component system, NarL family, invasion response regulator UvrY